MFIPLLRATGFKALCLQIYLEGMSVSHSVSTVFLWAGGGYSDGKMTRRRRGPEDLLEGERNTCVIAWILKCVRFCSQMWFLSCPPAQTDRSGDASGLWAVQGCCTVCYVSALTGLIRRTAQTQQGRGGLMLLLGDKTRQAPRFSSFPHLSAHLASHHS